MNTAVHGKASLVEMLLDASSSAGKSGPDDHDKTNTVDFGATLTSLIDQTAAGKGASARNPGTSAAVTVHGKANATAPTALESASADSATTSSPSTADAPTAFELTVSAVEQALSKSASTPKSGGKTPASAQTSDAPAPTSSTRSDSLAALLANQTLPTKAGASAANASSPTQISASNATVGTGKTSADDPNVTATSDDVTTGEPAVQSAVAALVAHSGVAATIDAPVSDADIAFDFRKELFSSKAADGAPSEPAPQVTSVSNFAKMANATHIDADANVPTTSTNRATDSTPSHSDSTSDGTSPALSTQSTSTDDMSSANPKPTQFSLTNFTANAAPSGLAQASQKQMDAVAQAAPQPQRDRIAPNSKEASTQSTEPSALNNDSAGITDAQPAAATPEAAAIHLTTEVTAAPDPSRTVSITVQLASGQTAQASVSERAGTVDVKILTPTPASAQRVSSEIDGLRQNLDAAGIKLGHSEISYQRGDGGGRSHEGYRPPAQQNQSANGKEVFTLNEVIQ
jgi:hypothetical protein